MRDYSERYREILEEVLTESQIESLKKMYLDEEEMMHLYQNEFNSNDKAFQKAVEQALESEKLTETHRMVKDEIQNLSKSIERYQALEKQIVKNQLLGGESG
jgi:hypothetical protein